MTDDGDRGIRVSEAGPMELPGMTRWWFERAIVHFAFLCLVGLGGVLYVEHAHGLPIQVPWPVVWIVGPIAIAGAAGITFLERILRRIQERAAASRAPVTASGPRVRWVTRWWFERAIFSFASTYLAGLVGIVYAQHAFGVPGADIWISVHLLMMIGAVGAVVSPALDLLQGDGLQRARDKEAAPPPPLARSVIYCCMGLALAIAGLFIVAAGRVWEGLLAVATGASLAMLARTSAKKRARS
jgi:hypothetical protein